MERQLPKNVRQIGNVSDEPKIYVEDYVDTFLNQLKDKAGDEPIGVALAGEIFSVEGIPAVYISGAFRLKEVEVTPKEVSVKEETIRQMEEDRKQYFPMAEIVGWGLIEDGKPMGKNREVSRIHSRFFAKDQSVFIWKDSLDGEEVFYAYKYGELMQMGGHYIFYEKNPAMQNYMISTRKKIGVSPSEVVEDRAAKDFRNTVRERMESRNDRSSSRFVYITSALLVVIVLVIGVSAMNNYDKMEAVQSSLESLSQSVNGPDIQAEAPAQEEEETTEPDIEEQEQEDAGITESAGAEELAQGDTDEANGITEDDYYGSLPLGRMAYMTGWVAAYFHRRWLYTQDLDFLRKTGYPALRKFAVFYAGFLQKGEDGFYHSFPSNQGESEFSREKAYDQTQVLHHACYALQAAAETATVLGVDAEDRILWQEIAKKLPKCEEIREKKIAPEYAAFDGHVHKKGEIPDFLTVGNRFHDWYFGQMPYKLSVYLRTQVWNTETWFDGIHNTLKRWQQPNHLIRAMSMATHGIRPAWTESLGIAGALTDLLILSDGGLIRLFPGIPQNQSASFITLRTENAFLVSAEKNEDCVSQIVVKSERGNPCRIQNPWPGKDVLLNGQTILSGSKLCFDTIAGQEYHLAQVI